MSGSDITVDVSNYCAAQPTYHISGGAADDTVILDTSDWQTGSLTSASTLAWSGSYDNYSISSSYTGDPNVTIGHGGLDMKDDCDIKIGERSLKEFMDKVEDQLAILRPAPALEEKWEGLKELRRQYESLKQDILEKEKLMKILKEK